jgi:hypothetical protein
VFADIDDHSILGGHWRANASHFGNKIVDLSINNLAAVSAEDIAAQQHADADKNNPMALRYIPAVGGFGPPVINEVTLFPSENIVTEAWVGDGSLEWQELTWEQNPTQYHIVNALAALPVLSYLPAVITKGSTNLMLPNRWTRTLG